MDKSLLELIKKHEGFRSDMYKDSGGVKTIGYGFTANVLTGKDGRPSMKDFKNGMTKAQADEILENIVLPEFINQVKSEVPGYDSLPVEQQNALVDLNYRNGIGNLRESGIFDAINDNDFKLASELVMTSDSLNKVDGKVLQVGDPGYDGIKKRNQGLSNTFSTYTPQVMSSSTTIDDEGTVTVPTEEQAQDDPRYFKDVSDRKISRKENVAEFREAFLNLEKPGKGSSAQDHLDYKMAVRDLLKKYPTAAALYTDSFDGKVEELGLNKSFLEGKPIKSTERSITDLTMNLAMLEDKVLSDDFYNKTISSRLDKLDAVEGSVPNVKGQLADGSNLVELPSGRNAVIPGSEEVKEKFVKGLPIKLDKKGIEELPIEDKPLELIDDRAKREAELETRIKSQEQEEIDAQRAKKMRKAEKVLSGLKAAAGVLSLSKALKDPEVDIPEISPLVMEAVEKQRQMAKSGLTAREKGAAMQGLNDAYAGAMKNVLRASGGQRGMFLANQGTVDANRIRGLNQLAAQDAAVQRQNIEQYNRLASSVGQMKLQRDMNAEQMKQSAMAQNRRILSGIGSNLVSDALSDLSYYINPNRDLIEQAQRNALEGIVGAQDNQYDPKNADYTVGGGNFRGQDSDAKKAQKANQEAIDNLNS